MHKNEKVISVVVVLMFLLMLLFSIIMSADIGHIATCHNECCHRCNVIHNSINLVTNLKNVIFVLVIINVFCSIIYYSKKSNENYECVSLVKMKVVLIE